MSSVTTPVQSSTNRLALPTWTTPSRSPTTITFWPSPPSRIASSKIPLMSSTVAPAAKWSPVLPNVKSGSSSLMSCSSWAWSGEAEVTSGPPLSPTIVPTTNVLSKRAMSALADSARISWSSSGSTPGSLASKNVSRPGPPVTRSLPRPLSITSSNGEPISVSSPTSPTISRAIRSTASMVISVGSPPLVPAMAIVSDAPRALASTLSSPSPAWMITLSFSLRTASPTIAA